MGYELQRAEEGHDDMKLGGQIGQGADAVDTKLFSAKDAAPGHGTAA